MRIRKTNFHFTIENVKEWEITQINQMKCKYLIHNRQALASGLERLEGYFSLTNTKTLNAARKIVGLGRAVLQIWNNTHTQATQKIAQLSGHFYTKGDMPEDAMVRRRQITSKNIANTTETSAVMQKSTSELSPSTNLSISSSSVSSIDEVRTSTTNGTVLVYVCICVC